MSESRCHLLKSPDSKRFSDKMVVADAHRHLKPGGRFCVVTISGLRQFIKRSFTETFGNYTKLKQGRAHTVSQAEMPL